MQISPEAPYPPPQNPARGHSGQKGLTLTRQLAALPGGQCLYPIKRPMIPTLDYVKQKFDEYNARCFAGSLRPLPVRLTSARSYLGQVVCKRRRTLTGTWVHSDFELRISTKIDRPEAVVEDTILHEMIHYWILSNGLRDTSAHGRLFRAKMEELNARYGRHITITHRASEAERAADTERRTHLICLMRLSDGREGCFVAAQTRLYELWETVARLPGVAQWQWMLTTDPFFNRFPRALRPKLYRLTGAERAAHLSDARPLTMRGDKLVVGR